MKVGIIGAGSMGLLLCQRFQSAGHEVSLLDLPNRVAQLSAAGPIKVWGMDGTVSTAIPALLTSDYSAAGLQDVVILATKAQDLPAVAENIPMLSHGHAPVIGLQNGIPWWYLHGTSNQSAPSPLQCLDPDGLLHRYIQPSQILGCVAYPAAMIDTEGSVRHVEGNSFPVGELDGTTTERALQIAGLFQSAGFRSRVISDIRSEIWLKLLGAVSINPVSALTRMSMRDVCTFPLTQSLVRTMMEEARDIAEALGITLRLSINKRLEGAREVGAHKTSMLQDVENHRPLELDALMLAVLELGELTGKPAPTIRTVYACAALLNAGLQGVVSQPQDATA